MARYLLLLLAAAAHQGWSANLFSTPTDMFPSTAVTTVVGIGGAAGAAGGAAFTWLVKHNLSLHPLLIFSLAACAYLVVPRHASSFCVPTLGHSPHRGDSLNVLDLPRVDFRRQCRLAALQRTSLTCMARTAARSRPAKDDTNEAGGHSQLTLQVVDHVRALIAAASSIPATVFRPSGNWPAS